MAAIFSTNQNRQFYVATAADTVTDASALGTIEAKCKDNELYFLYKGVDGVTRSDRIPMKNLDYAKAVDAANMRTPLKSVEVTLDSAVSATPVSGQDYVLRIEFSRFYGGSDEHKYIKDIAVHATAAMDDAEKLFTAMVTAANLSFSRDLGATATGNPYLSFAVSGSGDSAKLVITEKIQGWTLGVEAQERVFFDVFPTTIYQGGDDQIWGTVTVATPTTTTPGTDCIGNGKQIADLEWFCMCERGDQYRYMGWPNYIATQYMVNPDNEYFVLEFHFAFTDTGVNSYRSEKDVTIVADTKAKLNAVISAINTAAGSTLVTPLA